MQAKAAERAAFKEVRAISNSTSKRAAADARQVGLDHSDLVSSKGLRAIAADIGYSVQAARRDKRKAGGETCEHGVHRCRICFPIEAHK